jgi:hypothetical protein
MAAENTFPKTDGDILYGTESNHQAGNFITVEAGETISVGDVVFIYGSGHASEGEAWVSDANVQDKCRANGIAVTAATNGVDVTIQTSGVYYEAAAFTNKETYYLSATAGGFTTTASGVKLGIANNTGELMLNIIQDDRDVVGTIKAWLQDHANMIANPLTAFWKKCDGTAISDAESPLNGGQVPDLNANVLIEKYLRGAATSDDGTDNTAVETALHSHTQDVHGGSGYTSGGLSPPAGQGLNTSDAGHLPPYINVVWIMKIK